MNSRVYRAHPQRTMAQTALGLFGAGQFVFSVCTLLLFASLLAGGCATTTRPQLTDAQLKERAAADEAAMAATFQVSVTKLLERTEARTIGKPGPAPPIHVLAMSGGGDYGAFGAGFLVGWGSAVDPSKKRPEFDMVTGVSTGALLAPFAYIGTDDSCLAVETMYRNPKKDWLRSTGLFFFLPSNASFKRIPGLERDVRATIDKSMIEEMASHSRRGKVLAVSATDLDLGRQRIWDLGTEAEAASQTGDFDRVQRMLLASAAIPVAFPPVHIDNSIYGDGGASANILLRLEPDDPHALLPRWRALHPDIPLPPVRYWIIINKQLRHTPKTVQPRWPNVMGPSIDTSIRTSTIAEVRWLAAQADYINAQYGTDIQVNVVAIPDDWRPPVEGQFQQETMRSLADLGRKMGANPSSWTLWSTPRHRIPTSQSPPPTGQTTGTGNK